MRAVRRTILVTVALAAMATGIPSHAKGWEPVKAERAEAKTIARDTAIEIKAIPGIIIVSTSHQTPIKIFTILGRLVSAETLNAGTMQFIVPTHGVYIVKAGELTCKVAV